MIQKILEIYNDELSKTKIKGEKGDVYEIEIIENPTRLAERIVTEIQNNAKNLSNFVYEFVYSDCIWEGGVITVSVHKTKKEAYKAMRTYILDKYAKWYNERIIYGKRKFLCLPHFGDMESWGIRTTKLNNCS